MCRWDEDDYFDDNEVVAYCTVCGAELFRGDEVFFDVFMEEYYCSLECVFRVHDIERREL